MNAQQTKNNEEFRRTHPIPPTETADEKATREVAEKAEKAEANRTSNPDTYGA